MEKKISKLENSSIFSKLMKNDKFIDEILKTKDGLDLVKKFSTYGVDLNQIDFSELCKILTQKIQVHSDSYELNSLINSVSPDHDKMPKKVIVKFKEGEN